MLDSIREYSEIYQEWKDLHEELKDAIERDADASHIISLGRDIISADYAMQSALQVMYNEIY